MHGGLACFRTTVESVGAATANGWVGVDAPRDRANVETESPNAAKGAPHGFAPLECSCGSPTYMGRGARSASDAQASAGFGLRTSAPHFVAKPWRNRGGAAELFDVVDVILPEVTTCLTTHVETPA